jgi:hypothetical protein
MMEDRCNGSQLQTSSDPLPANYSMLVDVLGLDNDVGVTDQVRPQELRDAYVTTQREQ